MITEKQVVSALKSAKNVAIFCHVNPDPDAYGSAFAVREICHDFGIRADVFAVRNPVGFLDKIFPLEEVRTDFVAKNYDLVVVCDLHIFSRLDKIFVEEIEKAKNIINIDHHEILGNEVLITENIIDYPEKAATCEIICDIAKSEGVNISPICATYLWAGLMGDTDRFLHNNLSINVLKTAEFLINCGAKVQFVYDALYRTTTKKQLAVHKEFIDKIKFLENGKIGFVLFTLNEMEKFDVDKEDIKKYVNEITQVEGVQGSFLALEYTKDHYKISIRTRNLNAFAVAEKRGGGGHFNAAGFEVDGTELEIENMAQIWAKELINAR